MRGTTKTAREHLTEIRATIDSAIPTYISALKLDLNASFPFEPVTTQLVLRIRDETGRGLDQVCARRLALMCV